MPTAAGKSGVPKTFSDGAREGSTVGVELTSTPITKPVNTTRDTIAAERARMVRAGDITLVSPTIAAALDDDFPGDEWVPSGPSGEYTFLYRE
jgi:hypothetical protein